MLQFQSNERISIIKKQTFALVKVAMLWSFLLQNVNICCLTVGVMACSRRRELDSNVKV